MVSMNHILVRYVMKNGLVIGGLTHPAYFNLNKS